MDDEQQEAVFLSRVGRRRGQLQQMRLQHSGSSDQSLPDRSGARHVGRTMSPNAPSPSPDFSDGYRVRLLKSKMYTMDHVSENPNLQEDEPATRRMSFPMSYAATTSRLKYEQQAKLKGEHADRVRRRRLPKSESSDISGSTYQLSVDDDESTTRSRSSSFAAAKSGAVGNAAAKLMQKRLRAQALKLAHRTRMTSLANEPRTPEKEVKIRFTAQELKSLFCRAGRVLCILIRFCNSLRKQALARTAVTALQLQFQSLRGDSGSSSGNRWYHFTDFYVPQWAKEIALKPYKSRTSDDCQRLLTLLSRLHSFSEKFSLEAQQLLCRSLYYLRLSNGRVILREGHRGETAYFILSGSVFINVHDFDPQTKTKFSRTVAVLKHGDSFGEIALIRPNVRNATVITREPTELMVVERDVFLENSPEIFQAEFTKKVKFARSMKLLSNWPEDLLEGMCMESTIKEYKPGLVIERDTCKSKSVYLITDGACEVLRCLDVREAARASSGRALLKEKEELLTSIWVHGEVKPSAGELASHQAWSEAEPVWRQMLSSLPEGKKVFIRVNTLRKEDCCDLTCLVSPEAVPLVLISKGVKLLCIPKQALRTFAPQEFWKELKSLGSSSSFCLPDFELFQHYLKQHSWKYYKEAVVSDVVSNHFGCSQADKPVTLKGRTGWSRWPGRMIVSRPPSVAARSKCQSRARDGTLSMTASPLTSSSPTN